jgi:nitrogen regulatory protein PII
LPVRSGYETIILGDSYSDSLAAIAACPPSRLAETCPSKSSKARWWKVDRSPFHDLGAGKIKGVAGRGAKMKWICTAVRHDRHRGKGPGLAEGDSSSVAGDYRVEFIPKMELEVVVDDQNAEAVIDPICDTVQTGEAGDGKIFVYPVGCDQGEDEGEGVRGGLDTLT